MEALGLQCLKTRDYDKALWLFETKLQQTPNDPRIVELIQLARYLMNPPPKRKSVIQREVEWDVLKADPNNYYQVLGVSRDASLAEIHKRFKHVALMLHPDKNGSEDAIEGFLRAKLAFDVLSNPSRRKVYDTFGAQALIQEEQSQSPQQQQPQPQPQPQQHQPPLKRVSLTMPESYVNLSHSTSQRSSAFVAPDIPWVNSSSPSTLPTTNSIPHEGLSPSPPVGRTATVGKLYGGGGSGLASQSWSAQTRPSATPLAPPRVTVPLPRATHSMYEPPRAIVQQSSEKHLLASWAERERERQLQRQTSHLAQLDAQYNTLIAGLRLQKSQIHFSGK